MKATNTMRIIAAAFALVFFAIESHAAIASGTVWEIRTTGSATNGGGYSTGGTDYSQQDSAQIAVADAVTNGTTTITSATASFPSNIVGNVCYVSGGTGAVAADRYQVATYVSATEITVDRSTGLTAGTGVTLNCGGALNGIGTSGILGDVTAGNKVWVKGGTYNVTATQTTSVAGTSGLPISWEGYTTTRGDGGSATLTIPATNPSVTVLNANTALNRFRNFTIDCNGQSTSRGVTLGGAQQELRNIHVTGCTTHGINSQGGSSKIVNSSVTNTAALPVTVSSGQALMIGVRAYSNTGTTQPGISNSAGLLVCVSCISDNNTGDGFQHSATSTTTASWIINSAAVNNGRDGVRATAAASADGLLILNSILYGNTGYGVNSATTDWSSARLLMDYNAFGANVTAARNQLPTGENDVALSGDPFVNAATGNFALDATAGEGAACKAAGYPGTITSGTGYVDIGPLQAQCTGGSGGGCSVTFIQ